VEGVDGMGVERGVPSVKSFIRLTQRTVLNYSNTTKKQGELPTKPRMGQAFTYWQPAPKVSPDEGFWREAERR